MEFTWRTRSCWGFCVKPKKTTLAVSLAFYLSQIFEPRLTAWHEIIMIIKSSDWKKTSTFSLKICIISVHTIKTVVQKRLCNTFFLLEFTLPRKIIILFKTQKWHLNLGIIQMFYFVKIQKFLRKLRWKLCRSSPHASFREPKEALRRSRANHHHGQDRLQGCFYQRVRIFAILQLFPDFFKLQVSVRLSVDNRVRLSGECRENIFFSLFE